MEIKSSFRYDIARRGSNKKLEKEASIAISGFMNGHGGILIVGVDPTGKVVGLSKDYSLVQIKMMMDLKESLEIQQRSI